MNKMIKNLTKVIAFLKMLYELLKAVLGVLNDDNNKK